MELFTQAYRARTGAAGGRALAACWGFFIMMGLAACGGGSVSEEDIHPPAGPAGSGTAAPIQGPAPLAGEATGDGSPCGPERPTVQVRLECGFSFDPFCGGAGVVRLTQGAPAVSFQPFPGGDVYMLAYHNDTVVMSAPAPYEMPTGLPYGLDIYRGDVPIVGRQEPRCNPSEPSSPPCKPDTSLAFLPFFSFPTSPAAPRVVPIPPPSQWGGGGGILSANVFTRAP